MFKSGFERVSQRFLKSLKASRTVQIVILENFAEGLDNGLLENIYRHFLNNSSFELCRTCLHCVARNYYFVYIEISLQMTIIQFLCSKYICLWGHSTSKMNSYLNSLPYTISTGRPRLCKKGHFAWVGLGETLTFSLWKHYEGETDSSQVKVLVTQIPSRFLSQAWVESKWDMGVTLTKELFSKSLHNVQRLLAEQVVCAFI